MTGSMLAEAGGKACLPGGPGVIRTWGTAPCCLMKPDQKCNRCRGPNEAQSNRPSVRGRASLGRVLVRGIKGRGFFVGGGAIFKGY